MRLLSKNQPANFGYCISEHIKNQYDISFDEGLCYIWCAPLSINLCRAGELLPNFSHFSHSDSLYLDGNNPLAIENFSSHTNFILRYYNTNKKEEIEWLAKQSEENIKFLVSIANVDHELNDRPIMSNPIVAIAHYNSNELNKSNFSPYTHLIDVQFSLNANLSIIGEKFNKYWIIDGNENFNANRYLLIPPSFAKDSDYIKKITYSALLRQINLLDADSATQGIGLLERLYSQLVADRDTSPHVNLINNSSFGYELETFDLGRKCFAESFVFLREKNIIQSHSDLTKAYSDAGNLWKIFFKSIKTNVEISFQELADFYKSLIDAEKIGIFHLKKCANNDF